MGARDQPDIPHNGPKPGRLTTLGKLGWGIYRQIAAVLGAIALAAFLGHFVDIDWHGVLATMVGYWDQFVRPPMAWLLHTLVTIPLGWAFHWHIEVPLVIRDYLATGLILTTSLIRDWVREFGIAGIRGLFDPTNYFATAYLAYPPLIPFLWPLTTLGFLAAAIFLWQVPNRDDYTRDLAVSSVLTLSPMVYLCLLIAINYFIL